jgi:uncharacterized protein YdaU (DUF1376 family)
MSPQWMPLYIADYRLDTARLSASEHGAYLLLIMEYWAAGSLPEDDRQLARIAAMTDREWKAAKPIVQRFFQDGWTHKRIDAELKKAAATIDKRRAAAEQMHSSRRAKAHAHAGANAPSDADAGHDIRASNNSPTDTTSEASASSVVKGREARPPPAKASRIDPDWQLGEAELAEATKAGLTHDAAQREFPKFRDHFLAAPGERGRKSDWRAAWRNWSRKAAEGFGQPRQNGPGGNGSAPGGMLGAYQRAAARFPSEDDLPEYRAGVRGH